MGFRWSEVQNRRSGALAPIKQKGIAENRNPFCRFTWGKLRACLGLTRLAETCSQEETRLTIQDFEALCSGINRRSLQRDLRALIDKGLLVSEGTTHQQEYRLK